MFEGKKGQISTEYLIVVGFVVFFVITMLGVALFYSSSVRDSIRVSQLEHFAEKVISSAEEVYYAGEPSKSTMNVYLPEGVSEIEIAANEVVFTMTLSSGVNIMSYHSKVPLEGNISLGEGVKRVQVLSAPDRVLVTSN
jgi:uncharacterized protein (UPF0333 family)